MSRRVGWVAALGTVGAVITVAVIVVALIAALGDDGGDTGSVAASSGANRWAVVEVNRDAPYLPTLANANLSVGANRLSFTIQDADGRILRDLRVRVRLFQLSVDPDAAVAEQFAQFIDYGDEEPVPDAHSHAAGSSISDNARFVGAGIFVVPAFFEAAGSWGLEFEIGPEGDVDGSGGETAMVLFRMDVREGSAAPNVGELAPSTRSRTLFDEPDIARLTSDPSPEPGLYQLSIDEALAQPRPLIVIFSTPAFCHSRTCGPTLEVVKAVWRDYAGELDAIHVEVFENPEDPDALREAQAFIDWNLPSEPWVFVVDAEGRIAARFEGTITESELRGIVEQELRS